MTQEAGGTKNNNNGGVLGGRGGGATGGQVLKKGPWTTAEDTVLMEYVKKHGEGNWNAVQRNSGLMRCGKSCRLRWANHLRPNLKKGAFTPEEERQIIELHSKLGNKWARMALHLHGRTDNEIKNYWNTRLKRRQRAGLPIYPLEVQQNHQKPNSSSSSLHQNPNYNYSPTIFNTFTFTTPSAQYQPPDNSHIKLFRDTGGCVALSLSSSSNLPFSTPSSPVAPYNYNQVLPPLNFNMNHLPMVAGSSFNGVVALPQNELSSIQSPLEAITQASSTNTESDYVMPASSEADNYEIAPQLYSRGNNGLLGDVIGESQALMRSDYKYLDHEKASSNHDHKGKEKRIQDWELTEDPNAIDVESIFKVADSNTTTENHLEDSSSAHSSLEMNGVNSKVADEFEEMSFLMEDDLSTLLDFPIPTPLSDCYAANGNGTESSSFGKSSSSSHHHNVMINCINFGTAKNEISCSAAVVKGAPVAANHDLNQGSCCWNNMPGFC